LSESEGILLPRRREEEEGEEEEGEEEEALLFPSARELVERTSAETVVPLVACVSGM